MYTPGVLWYILHYFVHRLRLRDAQILKTFLSPLQQTQSIGQYSVSPCGKSQRVLVQTTDG